MSGQRGASINLLHLLAALAITAFIVAASLALLPEELIDYGIMSGLLFWTGYVLVSQWSVPALRRALHVVAAIAFISLIAFALWPFDSPM